MSNLENEKCLFFLVEFDLFDVLKRGLLILCEEYFFKCLLDWNCYLVNKLCVCYKLEDIIRIIWLEWCLFYLDEDD